MVKKEQIQDRLDKNKVKIDGDRILIFHRAYARLRLRVGGLTAL